ncbi:hypothetical protein PENTCL1PPCAC_27216 [Pristionchus entomophagus]|uniref:Uncharacterized protein n=1 Tax=Pristionchus entomophagus TaxID=358040 RepID=A0AAV5UEP6_9BILA|nr:hypothetical protein PENTCL1PPCAC_27216 [Pristionchus entomophagus]
MIEQLKRVLEKKEVFRLKRRSTRKGFETIVYNNSDIAIRVYYGEDYDPWKSRIAPPHGKVSLQSKGEGGRFFCIAPYMSSYEPDGSEHVM